MVLWQHWEQQYETYMKTNRYAEADRLRQAYPQIAQLEQIIRGYNTENTNLKRGPINRGRSLGNKPAPKGSYRAKVAVDSIAR